MKILSLFTAVVLASSAGAFAQQQRPISIEVIASFDYPGEGNSTSAQGINDQGEITGSYDDANGVTRGFIRYSDGTFSEPIVEPNDAAGFTFPRDINNLGTLAGSFGDATGEDHGFLLYRRSAGVWGGTFTEFDVPGAVYTDIYGLNDTEDLVGVSYTSDFSFGFAYARIGGTTSTIDIPLARTSFAFGINNAREVVGYYYQAGDLRPHGFYRAADGTVIAPIDPRNSIFTFLSGINEEGIIVGRYTDKAQATHGLLLTLPHSFVSFDYPGATFTSTSGINNHGEVTGRYIDASGLFHSYVGRVRFGRLVSASETSGSSQGSYLAGGGKGSSNLESDAPTSEGGEGTTTLDPDEYVVQICDNGRERAIRGSRAIEYINSHPGSYLGPCNGGPF